MGIWSDTKVVTQVLIETMAVCSKLQGLRAQTTSCTTIRCLTSLLSTCKTGVGYHYCLICSYDVTFYVVIRETSTTTQSGNKHARVCQSSLLSYLMGTNMPGCARHTQGKGKRQVTCGLLQSLTGSSTEFAHHPPATPGCTSED